MAAILGAVVASGCTTATAGTPEAASTAESSAPSADLPSDGAPKVENPLDVSHFEEHPCDALTAEDAKTLNVPLDSRNQRENGSGKTCDWTNEETNGTLSLGFFSKDKRGLSSVYREAKAVDWPYFRRIDDIEGHPAVAYNTKEAKPRVRCAVAIGATDQVSFTVYAELSDANLDKRDPCEATAQAAGMLLRTMEAA